MSGKERGINIIYASNDGYAGHLAASLCSLLDNNRQAESIDIYLLSVGMCGEYQERLKDLAASFGRRLFLVELGDLKARFPYKIDTRGFDISAFRFQWNGRCIWTATPSSADLFCRCMRQSLRAVLREW